MGRGAWVLIVLLATIAAACSSDDVAASSTTSTTTSPSTTATTLPPTTTTTTAPDPCAAEFCVLYTIAEDAFWSDGQPVKAADFVFTHQSGAHEGVPITEIAAIDEKTVRVVFDEPFGAWRSLFDVVLPSHVEPTEYLEVTAGPFAVDNWLRGDSITLTRNPFHRSTGDVSQITFVFSADARAAIDGLRRAEVDVLTLEPLEWMVDEVAGIEGAGYAVTPGPFWEHIDFNLDDQLLGQDWVREVIATAIPREAIIDETVRLIAPDTPTLNNTIWMTNADSYVWHYGAVTNPAAAEEAMVDHFCEKGDDGIYSCQGRRMSFSFAYPLGDPYRETLFAMVRDALGEVGIEVVERSVTPSELFSTDFFFGGADRWQMMSFSWKASEEPGLSDGIYLCEGEAPNGFGSLNVTRFCSEAVDALIEEAGAESDADRRADLYNSIDDFYLDSLVSIPLYQKPDFVVWSQGLRGVEPNLSSATHFWNVGSWSGKEAIVIGLLEEPGALDPLGPTSDSADLVISTIFAGAFTIDPSLVFTPDLIEDAQVIRSRD